MHIDVALSTQVILIIIRRRTIKWKEKYSWCDVIFVEVFRMQILYLKKMVGSLSTLNLLSVPYVLSCTVDRYSSRAGAVLLTKINN